MKDLIVKNSIFTAHYVQEDHQTFEEYDDHE